jgi:hypothetical protein
MTGSHKKNLEADPVILEKILSDLAAKNGGTLQFTGGGKHHAHHHFAHDEYEGDVEA